MCAALAGRSAVLQTSADSAESLRAEVSQERGSDSRCASRTKEEDKKMPLLLTDPQSQVFGDEEESDRCMQPLPFQITLK